MKKGFFSHRWVLGLVLVALSAAVYGLHYVIFADAHHIFIYLVGDIAFVFIEVLLVTMIIHQVLSEREKRSMLKKLNMVIGAFFSEVGTPLLGHFRGFDAESAKFSHRLLVGKEWSEEHFSQMQKVLAARRYKVDSRLGDIAGLKEFIVAERAFLLRLLENPNLLEHERFTELLWAVFHLADELSQRADVSDLPESDYAHLSGDITRAYGLLVREWLAHMEHLKREYPYLFSLAVRMNPFDPEASAEVA